MATTFLNRFQRDKSEKHPLLNKDLQEQQKTKSSTDLTVNTGKQLKQTEENRQGNEEISNSTINPKQRRRRSYVFATLKDVIALANNEDGGGASTTPTKGGDISKNKDTKQNEEIDIKNKEMKKDKTEKEEEIKKQAQQQKQLLQQHEQQQQQTQQPRQQRRYMRSATAASVTQLLSDGCNNLLQRFRRNPSERPEQKSQIHQHQQQQQQQQQQLRDQECEREKQQQQKLTR